MTTPMPRLQGIRGATTVNRNDASEILAATDELLRTLIEANNLAPDDIVSGLFTVTRRPRRGLSRPRGRGVRLEHRGAAARHRDSRSRARCRCVSGCWCMPIPPGPGRKSSTATCAGPRCSAPTGRDRGPRHRAWRRALGAGPSLDLPERRHRRPASAGVVPVTIRADGSSVRRCYSPAPRSGSGCSSAPTAPSTPAWWRERLAASAARRAGIDATAFRLVHGEGDGLPSLIVDRYDRWLVVQLLSAGLETMREHVVDALVALFRARGHPAPERRRRPAARGTRRVGRRWPGAPCPRRSRFGKARSAIWPRPWDGPEDRRLSRPAPQPAAGRRADAARAAGRSTASPITARSPFISPRRAGSVLALDVSADALARGAANAALNGLGNIEWREGDAFETLRALARARERFDTIVLDPPAFAKIARAVAGGASRLPRDQPPGDALPRARRHPAHRQLLLPCAPARVPRRCSSRPPATVAGGSYLRRILGPGDDHPEVLTIPETELPQGRGVAGGVRASTFLRVDTVGQVYEFALCRMVHRPSSPVIDAVTSGASRVEAAC